MIDLILSYMVLGGIIAAPNYFMWRRWKEVTSARDQLTSIVHKSGVDFPVVTRLNVVEVSGRLADLIQSSSLPESNRSQIVRQLLEFDSISSQVQYLNSVIKKANHQSSTGDVA